MTYKSVTERYKDEILTDNTALNHYAQCKDCIFRDETSANGWQKCFCEIFGANTVKRIDFKDLKVDYEPFYDVDKPDSVFDNSEYCEYYEKET